MTATARSKARADPLYRQSEPEGRWARLGPYYAMFPVEFAQDAVEQFSAPADTVVDPFCGRGTVPYVAQVLGRRALACDLNPVAWLYSMAKTSPVADYRRLIARLKELQGDVRREDHQPHSEFQSLAFCPDVLGFVRSARRNLDWRSNRVDRCLAAFVLHYLHGKLGQTLSNQLRHAKAMSPGYSVRWWRSKGLTEPPQIDPASFLEAKIRWRYAKGRPPARFRARVLLGDAREVLPARRQQVSLVVTSPPYIGVTDYRTDNWLRLWALGTGPELPTWTTEQKYANPSTYARMITDAFAATAAIASADTTWLIRCDARPKTLSVLQASLSRVCCGRPVLVAHEPYRSPTQTALYGDTSQKPGEIDLLAPGEHLRPTDIPSRFSAAALQ